MAARSSSGGALTDGGSSYDPGADAARRYPDWVIRHRSLRGLHEVMCPVRKVILLEDEHSRVSRRCSLAHAVAHIDLGHQATGGGVLGVRQEAAADVLAARRLVAIAAIAQAVLYVESFAELAHEVEVDEHMLGVRIQHMHPSELGYVREVMAAKPLSA